MDTKIELKNGASLQVGNRQAAVLSGLLQSDVFAQIQAAPGDLDQPKPCFSLIQRVEKTGAPHDNTGVFFFRHKGRLYLRIVHV